MKNGEPECGDGAQRKDSHASVVVWFSTTSSVIIRMKKGCRMFISFTVSLIQAVSSAPVVVKQVRTKLLSEEILEPKVI